MKKKITVAHSPDADDIFMYQAIKFGWVGDEYEFESLAKDIQTLNEAAIDGLYDVCAISFALYPFIKDEYALLKTAVSFGEGYGPKLIKKKNTILKPNFKVALSGKHTTNALIFRLAYPKARVVYMNFLEIEKAVLDGVVDAGVLIHESILDFDSSLCVEREIWDIWSELNGANLPLPLGGMVLRRSLPLTDAIKIEEILTKAVKVAYENKSLLSKMLIQRDLVRVDDKALETYLNLYANAHSITMDDTQLRALQKLFDIGYEHGFFADKFNLKDHLIPSEYKEVRFS